MVREALLLGLSTGTYCAMYCAPVAIPFLFSEEIRSARHNALLVTLFLLGRFVAYVGVGFLLGTVGAYATGYLDPQLQHRLGSVAFTVTGAIMLASGLMHNFPHWKACRLYSKAYRPARGALIYGFLTGINLCPPFFAAATRVFGSASGPDGALYFLLFFIGTSVYFLPLLGVHRLRRHMGTIRMISRLTLVLLGGYFLLFLGIARWV